MSQDWLEVLRAAVKASTLVEVGKRIGYSDGAISAVLGGKYTADTSRIQKAVEGALMQAVVDCPVLGNLPRQICGEQQRTPWTPTNPARVQLYHACRGGCPNAFTKAGAAGKE